MSETEWGVPPDGFYDVRFDGEEYGGKVYVWFQYATKDRNPTWGWDVEDDPELLGDDDLIVVDGVAKAAHDWVIGE